MTTLGYGTNHNDTDAWIDEDGTVHTSANKVSANNVTAAEEEAYWDAVLRDDAGRRPGRDGQQAGEAAISWTPVDLGPHLRGEITPPVPEVGMRRHDGHWASRLGTY